MTISRPLCEGSERRICFVPLGQVDPDLVRDLVEYYRDEYELELAILTPSAIPADMINPHRKQIGCESLADYMGMLFSAQFEDPNVVLIGLTPLDLYAEDRDGASNRLRGLSAIARRCLHVPDALGTFLWKMSGCSRAPQMVTKYMTMFFGLSPSDDPESPCTAAF
jgi:hypothetical protein